MARVLSDETSLARKKAELGRERQLLDRLHKVEFAVAGLLLAGGLMHYFASGSNRLLILAGILAFLALGHYFKVKENRRQEGIVGAGRRGEVVVNRVLLQALDDNYYIFNDLLIKQGRRTGQLDHLVVSPKGMFVIETKNWSGTVEGSENAETWMQTKAGHTTPIKLKNPLMQNQRHVEVLSAHLEAANIDWPDIFPLLVFSSRHTRFNISDQTVPVLHAGGAGEFIGAYQPSRTYSEAEVDAVLNLLMKVA